MSEGCSGLGTPGSKRILVLQEALGIYFPRAGSFLSSLRGMGRSVWVHLFCYWMRAGAEAGSQDGVRAMKIFYIVEHLQDNQTFYIGKIYFLLSFYCV